MSDGRGESLKDMQTRISGYHVYDQRYERVGKVNDLFIDENDELEYIGLDLGGLLKSKTALIPMQLVRINDRRDLIEIQADKNEIETSPLSAATTNSPRITRTGFRATSDSVILRDSRSATPYPHTTTANTWTRNTANAPDTRTDIRPKAHLKNPTRTSNARTTPQTHPYRSIRLLHGKPHSRRGYTSVSHKVSRLPAERSKRSLQWNAVEK